MHEHDGYAPHSHEVRADHLGVNRARPPEGQAPAVLTILGAPERCPNCGQACLEWPLGVHGGRLQLVCPACHVVVAPVVAVADSCEGEGD